MTKMLGLWFERLGELSEVLRYGEVDEPSPGVGEVSIAVHARVVQPADFMFTRGAYRIQPRFPQVAGFEGSDVRENSSW